MTRAAVGIVCADGGSTMKTVLAGAVVKAVLLMSTNTDGGDSPEADVLVPCR